MFHKNQALADRHRFKEEARGILDKAMAENRDLSTEEQKQFQTLTSKASEVETALANHRAGAHYGVRDNADDRFYASLIGGSETGLARQTHSLRSALQHATAEQREELEQFVTHLRTGAPIAAADFTRGGDAGVLMPTFVSDTLERVYSQFSPVASVSRLYPTPTGNDVKFPVLSDSESAVQVADAASTGADDVVSGDTPPTELSGPTLSAYKLSSKPVYIPRETLTDSDVNILEEVIGALLARVIRLENSRYTNGTGSGQAEGFLKNATPFEAMGTLDLDVALDLAYNVPAIYRTQGVYMMSDSTAKYLRKLKTGISGDKRALWADADATKGVPASLHGWPIAINNDMHDIASDGTYSAGCPLAFGDFKRFVIRQAESGAPFVYRYPVPAKDGVAAILFRRSDSKLLVTEAISKLTVGGS